MFDSVGKVYLDLETNYSDFQQQMNNIAGRSTSMVTRAFSGLGKVVAGAFAVNKLVAFGKASIDLASDLAEVQNVVDVVFGESSNQINNFSKAALEAYGLSELSAKRYASTMGAMLNSMGLSEDAVLNMSQSITALTGDMASFYNLDSDTAFQKIRSGISGETEPLKQLGINMSVANMEAFALSQGITKSYQSMTQAEQALLRYNYLLSVTSDAQGDFARTSDSWANQTRILTEQWNTFKATMGSAFISLLTPVVKMLNTLMAKLQIVAVYFKALAESITGVKGETSSTSSSIQGIADSADNVTASAEKAKKALAGFDRLNVLPSGDGGSGGGSGGEVSFDIPDFSGITEVKDTITVSEEELEKFKTTLDNTLKIIGLVGVGIGGWKLGSFIADLLTANIKATTLKETLALLGKKTKLTLGVTLVVAGIATEAAGIVETVKKGLSTTSFMEIVGGGAAIAGGGAMIGSLFGSTVLGAAIGAIVAGIPAYFVGIYDACVRGLDWLNGLLIPAGAAAAGAGIGAIIGMLGGPIGAGVGALIGLAVGLVTDLIILIVQNWDAICAFFEPAADWFNEVVITPIGEFFSGLWEGIEDFASACWEGIIEIFTPAIEWFGSLFSSIFTTISDVFYNIGVIAKGCWQIVAALWGIAAGWFNETFIQPLSEFFSGLWDGFVEKAKVAWEAVKSVFSAVANFFGDIFKAGWEKVVKVFSVAGEIFIDIKDAILDGFKTVVNGLITGINKVVAVPFNGLNKSLNWLKNLEILGMTPFASLKTVSVPEIPKLARGGIIDQPTLAMVGEAGKEAVVPLENTAFADAIANAIMRVLLPLFQNTKGGGGNSDGATTIILKVGEYELGRVTVGAINKYHHVIGKVELEV